MKRPVLYRCGRQDRGKGRYKTPAPRTGGEGGQPSASPVDARGGRAQTPTCFRSHACTTGITLCGFSERSSLEAWLGGRLIHDTPQ